MGSRQLTGQLVVVAAGGTYPETEPARSNPGIIKAAKGGRQCLASVREARAAQPAF